LSWKGADDQNADNHDDKAKVVEAAKPAQKQVQSLVEFFRQSPLMGLNLDLERTPKRALFLAGKAFKRYRASGGTRTGVLPDFFIGAHAEVEVLTILTRDARRYAQYFPKVNVIAP